MVATERTSKVLVQAGSGGERYRLVSVYRQETRTRGLNDLLVLQGTSRVSQVYLVPGPHHALVLRPYTPEHI